MVRFGGRTSPVLRANTLLELKLQQETTLEGGSSLPWFIITEDATVTTTVNERRVEVPSDFIREVEEKPLLYVPSDGDEIELHKGSYEELLAHHGSEAVGAPKDYALRGDYIMLFPKPDAIYTLKLPGYYARQAAPTDTTAENQWMKWVPDLLMALTGETIALQHIHDFELGLTFTSMKAAAYKRLDDMEVAREEANRDRAMG